jgi:hypothetical protein
MKLLLQARIPDSSETGGKSATGATDDGSRSEVRGYRNFESHLSQVPLFVLVARHSAILRRTFMKHAG